MCGTVTDQPPPAPEHVDDPWDGVDIDNAVASFFRALADGPLRDDALLAALRDDGAWGALGELADDDFAAENALTREHGARVQIKAHLAEYRGLTRDLKRNPWKFFWKE